MLPFLSISLCNLPSGSSAFSHQVMLPPLLMSCGLLCQVPVPSLTRSLYLLSSGHYTISYKFTISYLAILFFLHSLCHSVFIHPLTLSVSLHSPNRSLCLLSSGYFTFSHMITFPSVFLLSLNPSTSLTRSLGPPLSWGQSSLFQHTG